MVNQCLESLQVSKHPNKTFVGQTSKGFDFLGRHFQRYEISKGCMICVTPKKEKRQTTHVRRSLERPGTTCKRSGLMNKNNNRIDSSCFFGIKTQKLNQRKNPNAVFLRAGPSFGAGRVHSSIFILKPSFRKQKRR